MIIRLGRTILRMIGVWPESRADRSQGNPECVRKATAKRHACWGENEDVIAGYTLFVTLQLGVPLEWLRRQGERHTGPASKLPGIPIQYAVWTPKLKSWREMGLNIDDWPDGTAASDIGRVNPAEYTRFLIAFREAIESNTNVESRRFAVLALAQEPGPIGWFWSQHSKRDEEWFAPYLGYCQQLGLPEKMHRIARQLYDAGFTTDQQLFDAPDDAITKIRGIGRTALAKIREAQRSRYP